MNQPAAQFNNRQSTHLNYSGNGMNLGHHPTPITPIQRRHANATMTPGRGGALRHSPTQHRYNPQGNYHRNPSGGQHDSLGAQQPREDENEGPDLGDYNDPNDFSEAMQQGMTNQYATGSQHGAGRPTELFHRGATQGGTGIETPPLPPPLDLLDIPPAAGTGARAHEDLVGQDPPPGNQAADAGANPPLGQGAPITTEAIRRYMESPDGIASMVSMLMQRGGAMPTAEPMPGRHVYGPLIREYARTKIRNLLKDHTLAAYTRTHALNGDMYIHAPLALIRTQVLAQPPVWRQTHLPVGLADNNPEAVQNLDQFLRTMVKHERTTLRNLLLIQVRPEPRVRPPGPIPKLFDLVVLINNGLTRRHHALPRDELNRWATRAVRFRFAMLRLLAVNHYLNRPPGQTLSQWEIIDRHLEMLSGLSPVMIQAHIELVMRKDAQYFDGIKHIGDINRECITLPTDDKVAEEVARLNRTPAGRPSHLDATASTTNP
ncbi:uncharacterized protein PGTG_00646 [Puccinia graminis f. sp. tritici CRL 75-36-700-3]|uniref:Uncharacterized protein n=1 Tax=Puccinia graminis f. sp. tritici (strain CRL 75-36-700-3 / race SCCL) TaxID=418459 RepID=E3JQP1_PUCGT|nr:uncharacterized protein PGTG_00646 [Puccinia graminis f. sp. tritici CRL 75-36-700-3]EFP74690.2 hypothetical protein PGTG_00646 [Puccinia graminis f. sp. tritici CRL 75-36-700-3]